MINAGRSIGTVLDAPRALVTRASNSIAFRAGPLARLIVCALPVRIRDRRPPAPFRLVTLTGEQHIAMLRESLRSIAAHWSTLPTLRVVTDGTLDERSVRGALAWWPAELDVITRDQVIAAAATTGVPHLAGFAVLSAFGLKFVATVLSAREGPTLFSDCDILWVRDFPKDALPTRCGGVALRIAADYQAAYDADVARALGYPMDQTPHGNSGLVYVDGDLLQAVNLERGLEIGARRYNHFAEQTIFAAALHALGQPVFSSNVIACFTDDQQTLAVSFKGKPWHARHYVGPVRHLFWRDALALRCGVVP